MFGRNSKVNLELNREVEKLIKTGGKEQLLPIVQAGEPVLRQQTAAYEGQLSRKTLDKLIETMRVTMIEAPGVGLAATQIGLGLALAVVEDHVRDDDDDDPREAAEFPFHVIINPSYEPIGTETRSFSTSPPAGRMKMANSMRNICTAGRPASSSTKPTI